MDTKKITKMLEKLSIKDIENLRDEYKAKNPGRITFPYLCNNVIAYKQDEAATEEIVNMILDYEAKKNAPDGAATPSQGK